jgi:hypothetical protein
MKARFGALLALARLASTARSWAATLPDSCGDDKITFDVKASC